MTLNVRAHTNEELNEYSLRLISEQGSSLTVEQVFKDKL